MVSFRQANALNLKPRLGRLQDVQEELYRQLQLLIPEQVSVHDRFRSRVAGSPLLRLEVLERHPYTQFLRLTYEFDNDEKPKLAPDAHIRMYLDARMAEVTSFDPGQGCRRSAHPWYPPRQLMQKCWRQCLAMDKWLGYLLQQGHSVVSMRPAKRGIGAAEPARVAVTAG